MKSTLGGNTMKGSSLGPLRGSLGDSLIQTTNTGPRLSNEGFMRSSAEAYLRRSTDVRLMFFLSSVWSRRYLLAMFINTTITEHRQLFWMFLLLVFIFDQGSIDPRSVSSCCLLQLLDTELAHSLTHKWLIISIVTVSELVMAFSITVYRIFGALTSSNADAKMKIFIATVFTDFLGITGILIKMFNVAVLRF